MTIDPVYNIGETAFIKCDIDQLQYIVSCILITPNGLMYQLGERFYYEMELSRERNVLLGTIRN